MEILERAPRERSRATRLALVVTALLGAGCLVMEGFGVEPSEPAFSHRLHVGQEELECFGCHIGWEDSDEPGMPKPGVCALCHDDIDEEKPEEVRAASFFEGDEYKALHASRLDDQIVFSHLRHVDDEEGCVKCHAEVIEGEAVRPWMAVGMDDCVSCHAEAAAPNECATCHPDVRVDAAPRTHDAAWYRAHGRNVRDRSGMTVDRCDLCHTESSCNECHLEVPPLNHNNFWRLRGHGLNASLDRQTCAACHQEDFCARCHETTVPLSHGGLWGSPRNTHCLNCHLGDAQQGCYLCHEPPIEHETAPPLPPGHNPASDCRECHQLLSHVDNGDSCLACHN